jgi:uncharacterized membrane protein
VVEGSSPEVRSSVGFARIVAFTDGVFAIAITLLVLSLDVPDGLPESALHEFLTDSWEQLFAYFLSFAVIGRFWLGHHSVFAMLNDFDRRLMMLNLAYLALIALIPFPTELLGDYNDSVDATVAYAAVVGSASLLHWALLRYALGRGHVAPDARGAAQRMSARMVQPAIVFYATIPVAFLSPTIAQLAWIGLLLAIARRRG